MELHSPAGSQLKVSTCLPLEACVLSKFHFPFVSAASVERQNEVEECLPSHTVSKVGTWPAKEGKIKVIIRDIPPLRENHKPLCHG